jgi:2-isopropylmalate synthase
VRVFIESRDHEDIWSTIGVSEDIIEASWHALADSFHYKLAREIDPKAEAAAPRDASSSSNAAALQNT